MHFLGPGHSALKISVIVLVAVVMGLSAVVPTMSAYAIHPCIPNTPGGQSHECGNVGGPSCGEIAEQMRERNVPQDAIDRFLEICED